MRHPREPSALELSRLYGMPPGLALQAYRKGQKPAHADWPGVYVFSMSDGRTKVGYSRKPHYRAYEVGHEEGLVARAYWAVRSPDALLVERKFHQKHRPTTKRYRKSEFYEITPKAAVTSLQQVIDDIGCEYVLDPVFGRG